MLPDIRDYDRLVAAFRWSIPARYNIGVDVCDRWAASSPSASRCSMSAPTGRSRR
jgi:acetyl-CoA synthetase